MPINSLPNRKFHFKKPAHAAALNTAVILAMMVPTVIATVAFLEANAFIPGLHVPLIILIIVMAAAAYYIKMPPPYVELADGIIKVRKYTLGGWESAALKNLQAVERRENSLYMAFSDEHNNELEVKLDALSFNNARELQETLNSIASK